MKGRGKWIALVAIVFVAAATGVSIAAGGDDSEAPIRGNDRQRAENAALHHVGEGRVTDTEERDEESYYEVEVTKDDGSQVDVQLDRDFNVVGTEGDDESESGREE